MSCIVPKMSERVKYFYEMMVKETDECIVWPYGKSWGYGTLLIRGKNYRVHRLALEYHGGKSPKDKPLALHAPVICHNTACFNYRHLRWGNSKDNGSDMFLDGTTNLGRHFDYSVS